MNLQEAYKIGDNLVAHHLPSKWRFEINLRVLSRLGCCKFQQQVIEVSKFVVTNIPSEFVDTVLHEIAHARAGQFAGHGDVWKRECRILGCQPDACADIPPELSPYKWYGVCVSCQAVLYRWIHPPCEKERRCAKCRRRRLPGRLRIVNVTTFWVENTRIARQTPHLHEIR